MYATNRKFGIRDGNNNAAPWKPVASTPQAVAAPEIRTADIEAGAERCQAEGFLLQQDVAYGENMPSKYAFAPLRHSQIPSRFRLKE